MTSTPEVPDIFDFDEMLTWLFEQRQYDDLPADMIETAIGRLGRNAGPAIIASLWTEDLLTQEAATALVAPIWSAAEFPEEFLERETWLGLFELAGYTVESEAGTATVADRPAGPISLYRGSPASHRARMAWTTSLEKARWFAQRWPHLGAASVWTAEVEPWRILAACNGRSEDEIVINPDGLTITEVTS